MTDLNSDQARYAGLGLQFALTLVACGAIGWWLDSRFDTGPWLLVAGLVSGGVLAFYQLVRAVPPARPRPADPDSPQPPNRPREPKS